MPNPFFTALDDIVSATVDGHFGELAILSPRIASQYGDAAADPLRPETPVTGIFSSGPAVDNTGGQGRGGPSGGATLIGGQTLVFWLSSATVRALLFRLQRGDRVILPDQPLPNRYVVSALRPTDMGDLELVLTEDEGTA